MKPSAFTLARPTSLDEALKLRADDSTYAVLLAGGQSLMPLLNLRLSAPELIVDLNRIPGLDAVQVQNSRLLTGAMTRQAMIEDDPTVATRLPALHRMIQLIGHRSIRNRGTVGGSLCHADPSAELPALALALGAEMIVASTDGSRSVAAADFNLGYLSTNLQPNEMLVEVHWPLPVHRSVTGNAQFVRRAGDFALAAVLVFMNLDASGSVEQARVVAYGSLPRPTRLVPIEEALQADPTKVDSREMGEMCASLLAPGSDLHGSTDYKRRLFAVMCRRALDQALTDLSGG